MSTCKIGADTIAKREAPSWDLGRRPNARLLRAARRAPRGPAREVVERPAPAGARGRRGGGRFRGGSAWGLVRWTSSGSTGKEVIFRHACLPCWPAMLSAGLPTEMLAALTFSKLYKICTLLHRFKFNILEKIDSKNKQSNFS